MNITIYCGGNIYLNTVISAGLLAPWVIFSVTWTIGCTCDNNGRVIFDKWIKDRMILYNHKPAFPKEGLIYDYR